MTMILVKQEDYSCSWSAIILNIKRVHSGKKENKRKTGKSTRQKLLNKHEKIITFTRTKN